MCLEKNKMKKLIIILCIVILVLPSVLGCGAVRPEFWLCNGEIEYEDLGSCVKVNNYGDRGSSVSMIDDFPVVKVGNNFYWAEWDANNAKFSSTGYLTKNNPDPRAVGLSATTEAQLKSRLDVQKPVSFRNFDVYNPEKEESLLRMGVGWQFEDLEKCTRDNEETFSRQFDFSQLDNIWGQRGAPAGVGTRPAMPTGNYFVVPDNGGADYGCGIGGDPLVLQSLVLLVKFPDVGFDQEHSVSYFQSFMPEFTDYYLEQSGGGFLNEPYVYPFVFTASQNMEYYGGNYEAKVPELVEEALGWADSYIDFNDYDSDGDGLVDSVIIVHAGGADEDGGGNTGEIWSHYYGVSYQSNEGVSVVDYLTFSEESPVGIWAHEFGHQLGLPDLYDTVPDDGESQGVGYFSLMAYGGYLSEPADFDPWSKYYLGWLGPGNVEVVDVNQYMSLEPGQYLQVFVDGEEYFFIENRDAEEIHGIDTEGVLIWHVDESVSEQEGSWNGCTNSRWVCNAVQGNENHKLIDLEEASGDQDLDDGGYGDIDDVWKKDCGILGCTSFEFNDVSQPNSDSYGGLASLVDVMVTSDVANVMDILVFMNREHTIYVQEGLAVENGTLNGDYSLVEVNASGSIVIGGGSSIVMGDSDDNDGGESKGSFLSNFANFFTGKDNIDGGVEDQSIEDGSSGEGGVEVDSGVDQAGSPEEYSEGNPWLWIIIILILVGVGIVGVFFYLRSRDPY